MAAGATTVAVKNGEECGGTCGSGGRVIVMKTDRDLVLTTTSNVELMTTREPGRGQALESTREAGHGVIATNTERIGDHLG
jgi:hypothetical protein